MKSSPSIFPGLRLVRRLALMGAVLGATALTGCYVVPVNQAYPPASASTVQVAPIPSSVTFTARLYPANDAASAYGMVGAVVTNDLHGRGIFTTNINGESFTGEATRVAGSSSREALSPLNVEISDVIGGAMIFSLWWAEYPQLTVTEPPAKALPTARAAGAATSIAATR